MSVEHYFQENPADENFVFHMQEVKRKNPEMSYPRIFAEQLMSSAASEIRDVYQWRKKGGHMSDSENQKYRRNINALLYGALVIEFERGVKEMVVSDTDVIKEMEARVMGRETFKIIERPHGLTYLTVNEWEAMVNAQALDKTLSLPFKNFDIFPPVLSAFLKKDGRGLMIKNQILPDVSKRMALLCK